MIKKPQSVVDMKEKFLDEVFGGYTMIAADYVNQYCDNCSHCFIDEDDILYFFNDLGETVCECCIEEQFSDWYEQEQKRLFLINGGKIFGPPEPIGKLRLIK